MNSCSSFLLKSGVAFLACLSVASVSFAQQTPIAETDPGAVAFTAGTGAGITITTLGTQLDDRFLGNGNVGQNVPVDLYFETGDLGSFTTTQISIAPNVYITAFTQVFDPGGSFSIRRSSDQTVLLAGTFGSSYISGFPGSTSGNLNLVADSVVYTTYDPLLLNGFEPTNGSLSATFLSVISNGTQNGYSINGGYLNSFTAVDSILFSAQPSLGGNAVVPEPSEVVFATIAGMGLTGLALNARRSIRRRAK